ncbi:MAG: hypothetical protein JSS32_08180 [Verrucomicrobia bacterium]|nr:hypothetical protein [Verrucomicrobiota bacterium]
MSRVGCTQQEWDSNAWRIQSDLHNLMGNLMENQNISLAAIQSSFQNALNRLKVLCDARCVNELPEHRVQVIVNLQNLVNGAAKKAEELFGLIL